jgi:hypothetical protein
MSPADRAAQSVVWDRRQVAVLESLDDDALSNLRVHMIGMELDVATAVGFRLGEHAVHSWDVAVSFDPRAEIPVSSAELLVDRVGFLASRTGKAAGAGGHRHIEVVTVRPDRKFFLTITDTVSLGQEADGASLGTLELSGPALVRLVYGRLDPDHTPSDVKAEGEADLAELRRVFSGF